MGDKNVRLLQIINQITKTYGIKQWNYKTARVGEDIENYFGEIFLLSFTGVDINTDKELNLELFVKLAPIHHKLRDCGLVNQLYRREIYMYSRVFADYEALKTECISNGIFPKCYFTDATANSETVLMENKMSAGFQRYSEGRFMDAEHVNVALKSMAQFHALSLLILQEKSEKSSLHKEILKPMSEDMSPEHTLFLENTMNKTIKMFTDTKYERPIIGMIDKFSDALTNEMKYTNISVIGHGDFWKENVLYKYRDNKPVQACLIDFQLSRLMNPGFDVLGFLLNSVSSKVRRPHFQDFLQTYFNSLQQTLEDNNYRGNCYTKSDLNEDLKSIIPVCFVIVQSGFSLWLGLEDNILTSKNLFQNENQKQTKKDELKKILEDIVEDLQYFGFLDD